jgi:hypothetical protein
MYYQMSSVLNLSGLNYQAGNPVRREIQLMRRDYEQLKKDFDELKAQIEPHVGLIAGETLAVDVLFDASGERAIAVEGALIGVSVAIAG